MGACIGKISSNLIFFSEKFTMCFSFSALLTCLIGSLIFMLAFGIGIGYNYAYVDFRTKHTYLALEGYRKVRPTSYHGPGYYQPTTLNDSEYLKVYGKTKSTTTVSSAPWLRRAAEDKAFEYADIEPEPLPNESPVNLVKDRPRVEGVKELVSGSPIERLYFSTPKPKSIPFYKVEMTTSLSKDTKVEADAIDMNARRDGVNSEPITVNVTKLTRDSAPPLIIKTMMHPNQLMNWLSRLREANKTFAVHIITN